MVAQVPIYRLMEVDSNHSDPDVALHILGKGHRQRFKLVELDETHPGYERLLPIAEMYGKQARQLGRGIEVVAGVGFDPLTDDIMVVCLPWREASTEPRCYVLSEFLRAHEPPM